LKTSSLCEGGANFCSGERSRLTESFAAYPRSMAEATFDFEVRPLPYRSNVDGLPQNTIIAGASL
jgi:sn-glycerol 3-phosphate transport system substrate-binding protein